VIRAGTSMEKLSVCITSFNSERTLGACLDSVRWADEIVVLDSFSSDATAAIAHRYHCRFSQHAFLGYSKQKQMALDLARHRWVLLLDSDEALSPALQNEIRALLQAGPRADGYEMPRQEQIFWRMCHLATRMNYFLRLFDKTKCRMSTHAVHESPQLQGRLARLESPFYHYGETDICIKVDKLNSYSSAAVADKIAKGKRANPWILLFYPPLYFVRLYFFKRNFLNGWAGFITAVAGAFYVFLKYAKLYEHEQRRRHGDPLPPVAPPQDGP